MTSASAYATLFGLAVVAQMGLLTWRHWSWKRVALGFGGGLALAVIAFLRAAEHPYLGVLFGVVFLVGTVSMVFRAYMLPWVGETTLVVYTCLYWLLWATATTPDTFVFWLAISVGALPTIGTLGLVVTHRALPFQGRVLAYIWFLALVVALVAYQFSFGSLHLFVAWETPATVEATLLDAAVAGFTFAYLAAHATYLYWFVRLPSKSESAREYKESWLGHARDVGSRFTDRQLGTGRALGLVAAVTGTFLLDHWTGAVGAALVVSAWVLAGPLLARIGDAPGPLPAVAAGSPTQRAGA